MNLSNLLRRSLATLLLVAMMLSFVPVTTAAQSDIPKELRGKALIAELDESGKLVYREADESTKAVMRSASFNAQATQDFSKGERVAFFVDPYSSENSDHETFTINQENIENLTARGVTDFFVMTKNKAGGFSTTNITKVLKYAGDANVYAWMHCALDNTYIAANEGSAQYHFRVGRKCNAYDSSSDYYDSRNGFVDLRLSAYKTYFNGLVDQVEAVSGIDGVLLDSVKFGADYYGWDSNARSTMGTTAYNAAVVQLAAHHGYTYKTNSSGYYVCSGTTTADSSSLQTYVNANSANAQVYYNYRASVINGFISSVRSNLDSSLYLGVALESDWNNTYYIMSTYGQFPAQFKSYVSDGFCVVKTFLNVLQSYGTGSYGTSSSQSMGADRAKKVAKYGCNVFIGIDGNWTNNSTYPYIWVDPLYYQSYYIHKSRYDINGDLSYGGDILGAAVYTAGNMGMMKITLSAMSTTPKITVDFVNPNMASYGMLTYFHKYNSTSAQFDFETAGISSGGVVTTSGHMKYFANTTSSMGYIGAYASYTNATVDAYGTSKFAAPLKGVSVTYATMPFARVSVYNSTTAATNWTSSATVPLYPLWVVSGHESCTDFTYADGAEATCTTDGYRIATCTTCGYSYVEVISNGGHSYVQTDSAEPTCEEDGSVTYTCSECSESYTEVIAAIGHDYQAVVTAPTCQAKGYTTYTCQNDSSHTYTDSYTDIIPHNYVGGVCNMCGLTLSKLLHFKENCLENTWDWQMVGGGEVGFETSGDGYMYAAADGSVAPYFHVATLDDTAIDYVIEEGDVIEIRLRVTGAVADDPAVTPSVSLTMDGLTYGETLSNGTINLTTEAWQTIRIPIGSSYSEGSTIKHIQINPFGDAAYSATVEIDYIHIGDSDAVPVTVEFHNYDGTLLQTSLVPRGTAAEYYGQTPTKPVSAGFTYTFCGWMATDSDTIITDLSTYAITGETYFTAQFEGEFTDVEPLNSYKHLIDTDGDLEDYRYDIQIDAATYGKEVTINKTYTTPLDIVIVMDRSGSTKFHADDSLDFTLGSYSADNLALLEAYLQTLDKTKPEGYYTASNWLDCNYLGAADIYAGGYMGYENMRWNETEGYWEVWQTITASQAQDLVTTIKNNISSYPDFSGKTFDEWTFRCPGSVMLNIYNFKYHNEIAGSWVPVTQAFQDFIDRRDATYSSSECDIDTDTYPQENVHYRIGISRLGIMQVALDDFVDKVYATSSNLPQGEYHRIAVIGYGYGAYKAGRTATYSYVNSAGTTRSGSYTTTEAGDPGVTCDPLYLDSEENLATIHAIIDNPFAFGSTFTDDALKLANDYVAQMDSASRGADSVVVLFTDGTPTYSSSFLIEAANSALEAAKDIKSTGTKLYALGFMAGLNSATQLQDWDASATEAVKGNNFLHLVSSNYPEATSMTSSGSKSTEQDADGNLIQYYYSTQNGEELGNHIVEIHTTTTSTTEIQTSITADVQICDVVTREWNVLKDSDGNWDVTVQRCNYLGDGQFSDPIDIDNTDDAVYTLTITELTDESGNQTGETKILVDWHGVPDSWMREEDEGTGLGYKLLVTIGIELDREATIGGNNIPTNTSESGIYYASNPDLNHAYEIPNVNVEMIYDYLPHDYFLDLYNEAAAFDLLDVWNNPDSAADYIRAIYEAFYSHNVTADGKNSAYVDICHFAGESVLSECLAAGASEWTTSFTAPEFDFGTDLADIAVGYCLTPSTSEVDSLGRQPFDPLEITDQVNYYAPKYMVVDYGTTAQIDMGQESSILSSIGDNGFEYDGKINYTFRNDADNSDENAHILQAIETIDYKVAAIHTPKGASTNVVERIIHIIPANTVEYDYDLLTPYEYVTGSGYTGIWEIEGTEDAAVQNCDNDERHGYDSTLAESGADDDYSFGRSYVTTVSANVREDNVITEYHNNNALSFTFTGTGFDILSQTGPSEGTMVAEVYAVTDGTAGTAVTARYLVDNYMTGQTLCQLPVVHCTGLSYGTYLVVVRAYYHDAFNHYATDDTGEKSVNLLTEARIRNILGLSDDEPLVCSLSADRGRATRAISASSYDVHVDGVRIYNTLGTLSAAMTPIAFAVYGLEANATFISVRELLLDSTTLLQSVDENGDNVAGVAYIAADDETTDTTATTTGYHLSMDGILNHELEDGKYYLLDANNNRVTHPTYGTDIYFKLDENGKMVSVESDGRYYASYFCLDAEGNEVTITASELSGIIGKENIVYYSAKYEVSGPKNEIYLSGTNGIAFCAAGATLLQISANSMDGSEITLEAYDWESNAFVTVGAATKNKTAMYYDLLPYVDDDGTVFIRNSGSGILSLSNFKVVGAEITAPTGAIGKSLLTLQAAEQSQISLDAQLRLSTAVSIGAEMQVVYTFVDSAVADYAEFYVEITKEVAGAEPIALTFTVGGESNAIVPVEHPLSGEIVGYQIVYTGICAMEMGDQFTATLYAVDADGEVFCGNAERGSIQSYLLDKISSEDSSDELKTLAVDMLNYGAAAQLYFVYDIENLVNAGLTAQQLAYGTSEIPEAVDVMSASGDGAALMTDVSLQSKVLLYVSCSYAFAETSGLMFVIADSDSGELIAELSAESVAENAWRCVFGDVGASQMRRRITVELYDNGIQVSESVIWSVESYVAQIRNDASASDELCDAANAMLIYGDSAAVYLESTAQ